MNAISQISFKDKTALIRTDFNVPMDGKGKISDTTRVDLSLPTIEYVLSHGGTPLIVTHFGRPEGKRVEKYALDQLAEYLEEKLGKEVLYVEEKDGDLLEAALESAKTEGQIVLFENIRFFPEEEKNDQALAEFFAPYVDVYVNDAFSASHRAHASIVQFPALIKEKCMGLLFAKEIMAMKKVLKQTAHPMTLILGGAKMDTKAGIISRFIGKCDNFLLGGALANTFLYASGFEVGKSKVEKSQLELAQETMLSIEKEKEKFYLPEDVIVCDAPSKDAYCADLAMDSVTEEMMILDIGRKTVAKYIHVINQSKMIVWNGPLGLCEEEKFAGATKLIAEAIIHRKDALVSIVGGGDTVDALKRIGVPFEGFTHVSTAGGALIEYIEKGTLPGIEALS